MKRWLKVLSVAFVVLALSVSAVSAAWAAPQSQASTNGIAIDTGFAFNLYHGGSRVGTWTVSSDGSWVTTDASGVEISSGTLTMTQTSRGALTRVDMSITQNAPAEGTASLTLFTLGSANASFIVGGMSYQTSSQSGSTYVAGFMRNSVAVLSVSALVPVMFTGVQ